MRKRERERKRGEREREREREKERERRQLTWLTEVAIPPCSCIWSSFGSHGSLLSTFLRSPILLVILIMATSNGSSTI